jgi:alpha-beta hydrolase superfamily lysophospholipase
LYVYGSPGGEPVIVSSGDGGWIHLGPSVAESLAGRGCYVIGLDARAYLSSFTESHSTLRSDDVPGDFKVLVRLARTATGKKPILIGVSEGAGLSVLAATDEGMKSEIVGVIGLGIPGYAELGWRLKDVPLADVRNILNHAREPKRLWIVKASNHRFSDNLQEFDQRLLEAIAWVKQNAPR